jgi:hypothetical protein
VTTIQHFRLDELRAGDRLAQDIFVGTQVLLRSGTQLQAAQIERLRKLPLSSVAALREAELTEVAAAQYSPDPAQFQMPPLGGPALRELSAPDDQAWLSNEFFHQPVAVPIDISEGEKMFASRKEDLRREAGLKPALSDKVQEQIERDLHASLISAGIKKVADLQQLTSLADGLSESLKDNPEGYLRFADITQYGQYLASKAVSAALVFSRVCPEDLQPQIKDLTRALFALTALFAVVPGAQEPGPGMAEEKKDQLGQAMLRYFEWAHSARLASEEVLQTVLLQYERHDGLGVPYGLVGDMIPEASAGLGLAGAYAGKTISQPRSQRQTPRQAADYLISQSGTAFSGPGVNRFLRALGYYPSGALVELSDGRLAIVVEQNPKALLKPIVRLVRETSVLGDKLNLAEDAKVFIRRQLLEY